MKPGTMVAFILNAQIQFGVLAAIVRRQTAKEEVKQYVVTSVGADGTANCDLTITDEEHIVDMEAWNKDDQLIALAARTIPYQWAQKKAREDDEPVAIPYPVEAKPRTEAEIAAADDFKNQPL